MTMVPAQLAILPILAAVLTPCSQPAFLINVCKGVSELLYSLHPPTPEKTSSTVTTSYHGLSEEN
jgi:hypothetical protein